MTVGSKSEAKDAFKHLLVKHEGETSHPDVKAALDNLIQLAEKEREDASSTTTTSPWAPTLSAENNRGRWRSITTPPFPQKLPDEADGKKRFTLGRMSFGMFKPTDVVCAVEDIVNIVEPITIEENEKEGGDISGKGDENQPWTQTYTIQVLVEIETPLAKIPAKLCNYGICFPQTQSQTRLGVKFSSGTLQPAFDLSNPDNASLATAWEQTFDGAVSKESEQQSHLGSLGTWAGHKLMGWMMGLEVPVDTTALTQTYRITRPYVGHVDLLYLDDDFRVTRGNKGTIVATERLMEDEKE